MNRHMFKWKCLNVKFIRALNMFSGKLNAAVNTHIVYILSKYRSFQVILNAAITLMTKLTCGINVSVSRASNSASCLVETNIILCTSQPVFFQMFCWTGLNILKLHSILNTGKLLFNTKGRVFIHLQMLWVFLRIIFLWT